MAEKSGKKGRPSLAVVRAEISGRLRSLGSGFSGLIDKIRREKSPEAMIEKLKDALAANNIRHSEVRDRLARTMTEIREKKKVYEKAPPAERQVLKDDLRVQISGYDGFARQARVLTENIRILSSVIGRIEEVSAYGLSGVSEDTIDEVAEVVEEHAGEAEGRAEAAKELDRAGKRRDLEISEEDFDARLAEFDTPGIPEASAEVKDEMQAGQEQFREEKPEKVKDEGE